MNLFITAFIQVFFVAINTYFISRRYYAGAFICGFIISLIWSWNVRRIAFGTLHDRYIYASGAGCGSLAGLYVATFFG